MVVLIISGIILSVLVTINLVNVLFGPYLKRDIKPHAYPLVSVLVPARNEQENIGRCLDSLLAQNYPNFEIIVLDDESDDDTITIVSAICTRSNKIQLIAGKTLPDNWLGKNWACWQLSRHAQGEILLFVDVDTWHNPNAIRTTVGYMQKYGLGMLSCFPQQITMTFWEKVLVPLIDIILYNLLPLWVVYFSPWKAFAAANGQWLAVKKNAYLSSGGHRSVKMEIVEDVQMARLTKSKKLRIMTTCGKGMIFCRMYHNFTEIWHGLTKIMFGLSGNNVLVLVIFLGIISIGYFIPFIFALSGYFFNISILMIVIIMLHRLIIAMNYKHAVLLNLLFFPITIIFGTIIALNSFYQYKKGHFVWKGRKISMLEKKK